MDIFIDVFTDELFKIVRYGLKAKYVRKRQNSNYLKGKLILPEYMKNIINNKTDFVVECDELSVDIPENRILKTTLIYFKNNIRNTPIKTKILSLLSFFQNVNISSNIVKDLKEIYIDRTFLHYDYAIKLAKIFLNGFSFINVIDNDNINRERMVSFLFDMNKLFEKYVAYTLIEKYNYPVVIQKSGSYLAYDHSNQSKIFGIIPDIYLETDKKIYILDTKWKKITNNRNGANYGISQDDIYQILAYAMAFKSEKPNKQVETFLIYPEHNQFNKPLKFTIGTDIPINVIPFSLKDDVFRMLDE